MPVYHACEGRQAGQEAANGAGSDLAATRQAGFAARLRLPQRRTPIGDLLVGREAVAALPELLVGRRFGVPAGIIPAQLRLADAPDVFQQRGSALRQQQAEPGAPQEQVLQMRDPFAPRGPAQLRPQRRRAGDGGELAGVSRPHEGGGRRTIASQQPSPLGLGQRLPVGQRHVHGIEHRHVAAGFGHLGELCAGDGERVEGDAAEGGQLPAGHREQSRLVPDDVIARLLAGIGFAAADHRADAGKGADDIVERELQRGEVGLDDLHQVGDLFRRDVRLGVEGLLVIQVRGPHERDPFPGEDEDGAPVHRMQEAHRLRHGETPRGKDQMTAAQRANAGRGADLRAEAVRPRAGGVHHDPRPRFRDPSAELIAQRHAGHAPLLAQQRFGAAIVQRRAAIGQRLEDHPQDETRVIGLRVAVAPAPLQPFGRDAGGEQLEIGGAVVGVTPLQGQQVVHRQPGAVSPLAGEIALVGRQQETQRVNEAGAFFHQPLALLDGSQRQADFAFLEIADAAMECPRR